MKICKYCGAENADNALNCSSCGANDFKYKCGNCGTAYDEGLYCPKCGVKAGMKAKKCPQCGAEYFSTACPECGFISNRSQDITKTVYIAQETKPAKKRTWLWILGWICIFPVPLTILMVRNKDMNKWLKVGIIAVSWIVYLIIGLSGNQSGM